MQTLLNICLTCICLYVPQLVKALRVFFFFLPIIAAPTSSLTNAWAGLYDIVLLLVLPEAQ